MGFKTTFKAGYVKRIRPVCNAGLLLSSQTRNQEPTIRTVGLPELEMRIKINQPLRRKCATATTEKQQKETPILRWKNGPLFWVPYWKRNSAQCHHRKRTPKRGPFFGPQNGVRLVVQWWRLLLQRFCAWRAPGMKFFAGLHFWYGSWLVAWLFISHTPTYATVCDGCEHSFSFSTSIWTRVLKVFFCTSNVLVCVHVCFIQWNGLSELQFVVQHLTLHFNVRSDVPWSVSLEVSCFCCSFLDPCNWKPWLGGSWFPWWAALLFCCCLCFCCYKTSLFLGSTC